MNIRNAHSYLARAFAGAALAASIVASVSPASAVTCTFLFPGSFQCIQGTSSAGADHRREVFQGRVRFNLSINMQGGTQGAVAYGIDVNGTHLNKCATTVADDDPSSQGVRGVSCAKLYGTSGTAPNFRRYDYPQDMRSTVITVI